MFQGLNLRWTRILFALPLLFGMLASSVALAGNTHSEAGPVVEAPGVPETDGTASVQVYWTGDSATRVTALVGSTLAGHWIEDAGFAFARQWLVGDAHVAYLEFQTGAGSAAHTGYYGASTKSLTSLDPDVFPSMTVRPIPVPLANAGGGYIDLAWNRALSSGATNGIAGYNVYRSQDGTAFAKLNAATLADTTYRDTGVVYGETYYYAVGLAYAGTPVVQGTILSANSAPVASLDATPPNVPVLAAEPPFTAGTSNLIAWSSEAASGATAYLAECALDSAFTSLVGNSGWIADSTHTFTGLADGSQYFFRVRARDAALNESVSSARQTSRQDATPPQSYLLALTDYKASSTVSLDWTGADSTSGIASVQLYYAKDGGAYTLYPGGPFTVSPIAFDASTTGGDGVYAFYTLATDAVANAESVPEAPDATTTIDTQAPEIPVLASLPAFTAGASRDVSWNDATSTGAVAYEVQAATSSDFATIASQSSWIAATTHAFASLADGQSYWYRVRSRDLAGNDSDWSDLETSRQDASPPQTAVQGLPAATPSHTFDVAWTGTDAASGLASVDLYYSKDGGAFVAYTGGPFATSPIAFDASTTGGDGQYAFYTLGTDALGNVEAAPATADAQTTIDTAAPGQPVLAALPSFTAGTSRSVSWTDIVDAEEYLAQVSTDAAFSTIIAESGWTSATSHAFTGLSDGQEYFYRVRGRDAALNETPFSPTASSTQDATAPESQLAVLAAYSKQSALSLAWSGTDATSGVASVDLYYTKDGGPATLHAGSPFASSPIAFDAATTGGDGNYTFYVRGRDVVGNLENAPAVADASTRIDTAAPSQPTLASLGTFTAGTSRALSWSGSDADEYRVQASTDASFTTLLAESGWMAATSHTFIGLADGQTHHYRVQGRDLAGNESAFSAIASSTQDATAPASALAALPALSSTSILSLEWSGSDATSGLAGVQLYYSKDGGAYDPYPGGPFATSPILFDATTTGGDGDYRFYTRANDAVGNFEAAPASPDAQTSIDTAAPGAPDIAGIQTYTAGTTLVLAWSDESATGAVEYLAEMSMSANFASIAATSGWISSLTHPFSGLTDGQSYFFRVRARDVAHNETGWSGIQSTTLDATPPATAIASLPALTANPQISLSWSGSDAASGIEDVDVYFSRNGAAYALLPGSPYTSSPIAIDATTMGGDGTYGFYSRARDGVGNLEAAPAAADAEITVDTTAPAIPSLAALPSFTAGNSLALTWSDESASGALEYRAQASFDAAFTSIQAQSGWMASTTHVFNGLVNGLTYSYRVQARDLAGNTSTFSATRQSTQDAGAPTSQILALPAQSTSSSLQIAWSAFDALSGLSNVDLFYSKDGGVYQLHPGSPFTSSPIAFDATSTGGDGHYAFYTRARDVAGNYEAAPATADAQTTIDTMGPNAPAIAALTPFSAGSSLLLSWSDESATGAIGYRADVALDPSFTVLAATSGWIPNKSFVFSGLADGSTYHFRVKARDAALNESLFASLQSTTMDDTSPASSASALPAVVTTPIFSIAWTASDATSGIETVDLYYAHAGGAYTLYAASPFATSPIAFDIGQAAGEGNYAFYTRARDNVGNREAAPAGPDATTLVSTSSVGTPAIASLPQFTQGTSRSLSWSAGPNNAAYLAQVAEDADFQSILAASGWITSMNHTFTGLADGDTYYYRVKGRNSMGVEGNFSSSMSSTQDATAPQSSVSAMPASRNVRAFNITWTGSDATSGLASVELHVSRNGGAYAPYAGGPFTASPIAFDAAGLGGDGTYAFYTVATDRAGNLETAPATADASTTIDSQAPPAPVMAAEPPSSQGRSNTVSWSPVAGAASYFAQCATDDLFLNVIATTGWISATSHTFIDLQPGTTYYYRVRARDAASNASPYSTWVSSTQALGTPLAAGWNLVSFNVTPPDSRIDLVLGSIQGSYSIVRTYTNGGFRSYLPSLPLEWNDLTSMNAAGGYWIYMTRSDTLEVAGAPVLSSTPISLASGWNLVGYLPGNPMPPAQALVSIQSNLAVARGYDNATGYRTFYPALPNLSDLGAMLPGAGYWMYMHAADDLVYGALPKAADLEAPARDKKQPVLVKGDAAAVPTVMDVWSREFTIDGDPAPAGTVLEAYDAESNRCGSFTVKSDGQLGVLHLHGDVSITEEDEGAVAGDAITFKVRGLDLTLLGTAVVWEQDAVRELKLEFVTTASLLPKKFALAQNQPNPFNPSTTIAYAIPGSIEGRTIAAAKVSLAIYDIRGRVVRTLVRADQAPGRYAVVWNGRDEAGNTVSSGIYFYRLQADTFSQARKMMLMK